jgi:hypothetical protein
MLPLGVPKPIARTTIEAIKNGTPRKKTKIHGIERNAHTVPPTIYAVRALKVL